MKKTTKNIQEEINGLNQFFEDMEKSLFKEYSKEDLEELKNEIPLERIGTANNIAKSVAWLIEDDYTTGEVISINGGWNM